MIVIYIINAIFNAILFGIYFDLLEQARRRQNAFQSSIDNANTAMSNLQLPERLVDTVLTYILQTHETKVEQDEFMAFSESMPPSKNLFLNALNFKKVLRSSQSMICLRLYMKEQHSKILKNVQAKHLNDPNADKVDLNKSEKEYRKLIKTIIYKIKIEHVEPEEVVILQGDTLTDPDGEYD